MGITIQVNKNSAHIRFNADRLQKLIKKVCRHFHLRNAAIEIEIVGDSLIRKLNRKFLGNQRATDCISFDLTENNSTPKLYQIVVNAQRARREAKKRNHSHQAELALYVLHGLLHNLGFDDKSEKNADTIHKTEDRFLQEAGYGIVYNNRQKRKNT